MCVVVLVCVCVLVCMCVYHQDICVHMERRGNLLDICFVVVQKL